MAGSFPSPPTMARAGQRHCAQRPCGRQIAVDQGFQPVFANRLAQAVHRQAHRQHRGAEDVEPVDRLHIHHADAKGAAAADGLLGLRPRPRCQFLGIAYALWSGLAQQHGCGHNRPGKRPAPGLIHTRNQRAGAERGTKLVRRSS